MRIVLISPPASTPFAPTMSLVALQSYLRADGVTVDPIDANIEAIHYVLKPQTFAQLLKPALPTLKRGLPAEARQAVDQKRLIDADDEPVPLDESRAAQVTDRLAALWTDDGFELTPEGFKADLAVINDALILASLRMAPHCLTVWGANPGVALRASRSANPYVQYFRGELLGKIASSQPDVIGISLSYADQGFYGSTLVELLRQYGVDAPIALGGSYFNDLCKTGADDAARKPFVDETGRPGGHGAVAACLLGALDMASGRATAPSDAVTVGVRGEGEGPLLEICRRVERGEPAWDIPGLVYVDRDEQAVVINKRGTALAGKDLPKADLTGLPVGKAYLSPLPMAPLMSSRGCYWDKCTFCDHARTIGSGYRQLPADVVADSMETYSRDFGVKLVMFCDETMSPAMMKNLTAKLAEKDLVLPYGVFCRMEEAFVPLIAPAAMQGLSVVCLGLESACDRVLSLMNKGYRRDLVGPLLDEYVSNGVAVLYFVIFGFPTETTAEADQTVEFLDSVHDKIWLIAPYPWTLTDGSYVKSHPDEFGIVAAPGKPLSPGSITITEGISRQQAWEYVYSLREHPRLKHCVTVNENEDGSFIRALLERPRPGSRQ